MAVPIFMVISGFVYTKSFERNEISSIEDAYSIDVILGKIIRYSVPFAIAFIIEVAYSIVANLDYDFMQTGLYFIGGGFGPGSYYYPIMMQFIFYFPAIYFLVRKYDFQGVFFCGLINVAYEIVKRAYFMNSDCYRLLLFRYTLLIAYGCYLAIGDYKRHKKASIICILVGVVYIIIFKYLGVAPPITNYKTGTCIWACMFIIPLARPIILNNLHNRLIEALGKASYNIFLTQMVYYYFVVSKVYEFVDNRLFQLLLNIIICVSTGLIFFYIETPITKWVNTKAYEFVKRCNKAQPKTNMQ